MGAVPAYLHLVRRLRRESGRDLPHCDCGDKVPRISNSFSRDSSPMTWPCHLPDLIHSLYFVCHPSCHTTIAAWALRDAAMPSAKRPCLRCKGTYSCYRTTGFSPGYCKCSMSTGADHIVQKGTRSVSKHHRPAQPTDYPSYCLSDTNTSRR